MRERAKVWEGAGDGVAAEVKPLEGFGGGDWWREKELERFWRLGREGDGREVRLANYYEITNPFIIN